MQNSQSNMELCLSAVGSNMEWETHSWIDLFWESHKITSHSTPFSQRPAPTTSPNLSKIQYPDEDMEVEEQPNNQQDDVIELIERMARLKLE